MKRKINDRVAALNNQIERERFLAKLAELYVSICRAESRKRNEEVARELSMKVTKVRDAIRDAKQRGFLTPVRQQGVQGGDLTAQAMAALKRKHMLAPRT